MDTGGWAMIMQRLLLLMLLLLPLSVAAQQQSYTMIAQDVISMHSGPGSSFPIFYEYEPGESFRLLKRRASWVKVENRFKVSGWLYEPRVHAVFKDNQSTSYQQYQGNLFGRKRIALGFGYGWLEADPAYNVQLSYYLRPFLSLEGYWGQAAGRVSSTDMVSLSAIVHVFVDARVSPFLLAGAGKLNNIPRAQIFGSRAFSASEFHLGAGLFVKLIDGARLFSKLNFYFPDLSQLEQGVGNNVLLKGQYFGWQSGLEVVF